MEEVNSISAAIFFITGLADSYLKVQFFLNPLFRPYPDIRKSNSNQVLIDEF